MQSLATPFGKLHHRAEALPRELRQVRDGKRGHGRSATGGGEAPVGPFSESSER